MKKTGSILFLFILTLSFALQAKRGETLLVIKFEKPRIAKQFWNPYSTDNSFNVDFHFGNCTVVGGIIDCTSLHHLGSLNVPGNKEPRSFKLYNINETYLVEKNVIAKLLQENPYAGFYFESKLISSKSEKKYTIVSMAQVESNECLTDIITSKNPDYPSCEEYNFGKEISFEFNLSYF